MRRVLYAVLFSSLLLSGFSQIVITATDMPSGSDTLRYTNIQLNSLGNYQQSGPNFNWDFSQVSLGTPVVRNLMPASQTPYFFFFLSPNEYGEKLADTLVNLGPVTLTKYYNYYRRVTSPQDAYIADGMGLTFSTVPLPSYYTNKDELYFFPLNYGDRDSSTFRFSTPNFSAVPIRYTKTGHRITEVDGWGTITTPYGSQNCLRVVTTQYGRDTIKNNFIPIPVGYTNYIRSYQWLVPGGKLPYFEVSGTLSGNNFIPNQARMRGYALDNPVAINENSGDKAISLYPQPVHEKIYVDGTEQGAMIEVYDLLGHLLHQQKASGGSAVIDAASMPAGVYILTVEQAGAKRLHKFIKD